MFGVGGQYDSFIQKTSNPEWTDAPIEVELAALSPLTIQAFNKDTFTVSFKNYVGKNYTHIELRILNYVHRR